MIDTVVKTEPISDKKLKSDIPYYTVVLYTSHGSVENITQNTIVLCVDILHVTHAIHISLLAKLY